MYFLTIGVGLTAALIVKGVSGQECAAGTAQEIKGNWYCSEVKAITYENFPGNGSYNKVTNMNEKTGECDTVKYDYAGSLAPLNEELSLHVRGPIWLKQFAFYKPGLNAKIKKGSKHSGHNRRHQAHQFIHDHGSEVNEFKGHDLDKRSVGQLISATIDGQVASWTNLYAGPGVASNLPSPVGVQVDEANGSTADTDTSTNGIYVSQALDTSLTVKKDTPMITESPIVKEFLHSLTETSTATPSSPISTNKPVSGKPNNEVWTRQAYFDAGSADAEGITFLNHFGGMDGIPGTAAGGPAFGASLSYATTDGKSGSKFPVTLHDAMIDDDVEVILMSNRSCQDGGCGFARPGGVNFHGFNGDEKIFLFEFTMPDTSKTGFNANMPAIWVLNAQVPRTSQYGTNPECSCWTSGCGEFDLFEVLDSGNFRCKSTLHMEPAGGSSDWLRRPAGESTTAALVIGGSREVAAIRVFDRGLSFGEVLDGSVVQKWLGMEGSVFKMAN